MNIQLTPLEKELIDVIKLMIEESYYMRQEYSDMDEAVEKAEKAIKKALEK